MKRLVMLPESWPCTLGECRPGHFLHGEHLGFKSEYHSADGKIEAYNAGGEFFWAEAKTEEERRKLIVQPVCPEWEEYEE